MVHHRMTPHHMSTMANHKLLVRSSTTEGVGMRCNGLCKTTDLSVCTDVVTLMSGWSKDDYELVSEHDSLLQLRSITVFHG